ncbi:MAG: hypothetical protein A3F83_00830 [Candidatus Glassbacteria bacterium RIFCSPLOWO2_12_FULL_58_11]|uniref:ABC transporter permease n=1 Tax=Candidatus Glassbacteria bacterium RIFCSPLOWO2_12_FULL_58_11 TaxID=1817867 RepID=A0A1F5YV06_9BACT|nr:MAG: hypothetical protein A3F83_00830 [Candidatus Glassbacteria bacterium RIFCSPLOWO2_12_FULL_58_11]
MLKDIIRKELLDTISSLKFVFTFLLCTVMILLSIYIGINNYRSDLKEYQASVALNRSNLESQPSYQALAGLGVKISKPPQVLSTLVTGIQNAVGRVASVKESYDPELVDSKYSTSPIFSVFGDLDLEFIVRIVLSLLAILFTYDAICGEKESGTLKMSLANSLPRDRLIIGKAVGSFISLLIPLMVPLLLGLLILSLYPDINLGREEWSRIGLLVLLFLLYISVFFSLGIFVSTLSTRSSVSILILLIAWVTFVTLVPKAAVIASGQIYPVPSVHEITAQKDAFQQEIQGNVQKEVRDWVHTNSPKPGEDPKAWQEKFTKYLEDSQQEASRKIDEKNAALESEFQARRQRQDLIAMNLSRISPASALMYASMSLSGTGINEHIRFLNSIKNYKPVWTKWANSKRMRTLLLRKEQPKPDLSDMPRHTFTPESFSQSARRAIPDFTIMLVLIILFIAGAYVAFLKYDVR